MSALVCPAGAERTRDFVDTTFGAQAAGVLDGAPAALAARERRIRALRSEARLREAERFGWASLAGILLRLPLPEISSMAVGDEMLVVRAGPADPLPAPLFPDPGPVDMKINGTDIVAVDPTDPAGYALVELSAQIAAGSAAVNAGGRALAAAAVASALSARLSRAAGHG